MLSELLFLINQQCPGDRSIDHLFLKYLNYSVTETKELINGLYKELIYNYISPHLHLSV